MKKILSMLLVFTLIFSSVCVVYGEEANQITVYFNLSIFGKLAKDKDGKTIALSEVNLSGKESYSLDDAIYAFHNLYYEGGAEAGYETETTQFGLSVKKFFGDETGKFSYQINTVSSYGPSQAVSDGDVIDFSINESYWPDTENYSFFDSFEKSVVCFEPFEITLKEAGYDKDFNTVFSPCQNAALLIDGEETDIVTDENGKATLELKEAKSYIISAKKEKTVIVDENNQKQVCAITAPCMKVSAEENPYVNAIKEIKDYYSADKVLQDGNMHWFIADLSAYSELFEEGELIFSEKEKQSFIDKLSTEAYFATSPSALAKVIISLRALGYNAKNINLSNGEKFDAVEKLSAMVDERKDSVLNIYTLPYVLIALNQHESYKADEQISFLVETALSKKESWQSTSWGTDGATPMVIALSPFSETNPTVQEALLETEEIIKACQEASGLIGNAASTGLAIAAFSALGIDSKEIKVSDVSLLDALLTQKSDNPSGFLPIDNSFSTEQGFRGLLSYQLMKNKQKRMFDFSSMPFEDVYATKNETTKVTFSNIPSNAIVTIDGAVQNENDSFVLSAGTYNCIISALGYTNYSFIFEINDDDIIRGEKVLTASLSPVQSGSSGSSGGLGGSGSSGSSGSSGGSGGSAGGTSKEESSDKAEDKETEEKSEEKSEEIKSEPEYTDVKKDDWFFDAVSYVHKNNLMNGTEKGFEPESKMTRAMLVTVLFRMQNETLSMTENKFSDVNKDDWFYDAVLWASNEGIVSGTGDETFAPNEDISREQIAVILYRYFSKAQADISKTEDLSAFEDKDSISPWAKDAVSWAKASGIISGTSSSTLSPKETASRAEVAQILYNISKVQ